jgi:hypothetical protein
MDNPSSPTEPLVEFNLNSLEYMLISIKILIESSPYSTLLDGYDVSFFDWANKDYHPFNGRSTTSGFWRKSLVTKVEPRGQTIEEVRPDVYQHHPCTERRPKTVSQCGMH